MNIVFLITACSFFIWVVRNVLFWVNLWQVKEYRSDRLIVYLRETVQGKNLLFSPFSTFKWILLFASVFVFIRNEYFVLYQLFIAVVFILQAFFVVREFSLFYIKRPVPTVKAIGIIGFSVGVIFLFYLFPLVDQFLWLLLLDRIIPYVVAFFVFSFWFPTEMYHDIQIEKAMKIMKKRKNIIVIGVTGSYGKSSTKEYVAQILQEKFRVLKTKGTNNTPIGVANTILHGLKPNTQVFVVEMGAYKTGEIREICQIVNPTIGILTAVNYQHVSLFGNLQNTMQAKYELIDALPRNGLSLFNGNNANAALLYHKTHKKKNILYFVNDSNKKALTADITASHIQASKTSVNFDVELNGHIIHFKTPLIGAHNVENILPGIYMAHYLGMSEKEIKNAVAKLVPLPKTMARYQLPSGTTLVDDTFNATPEAILAALDYMMLYKGKRMMVLQPMIELGENAVLEHYRIGKKISQVCDYLFLTNGNFYNALAKGIKDGKGNCIIKVAGQNEILQFINDETRKEDVVLFESKEASVVLSKLL